MTWTLFRKACQFPFSINTLECQLHFHSIGYATHYKNLLIAFSVFLSIHYIINSPRRKLRSKCGPRCWRNFSSHGTEIIVRVRPCKLNWIVQAFQLKLGVSCKMLIEREE